MTEHPSGLPTYVCDDCGTVTPIPPFWRDETNTVWLCSPDCAERAADTTPR